LGYSEFAVDAGNFASSTKSSSTINLRINFGETEIMPHPKLSLKICREAEELIKSNGHNALQIAVDRAVYVSKNNGSAVDLAHIDSLISAVTERLHNIRASTSS
jgi:hypothetical protein